MYLPCKLSFFFITQTLKIYSEVLLVFKLCRQWWWEWRNTSIFQYRSHQTSQQQKIIIRSTGLKLQQLGLIAFSIPVVANVFNSSSSAVIAEISWKVIEVVLVYLQEKLLQSLMNLWRIIWRVVTIVLHFVISRYFKIILVISGPQWQ